MLRWIIFGKVIFAEYQHKLISNIGAVNNWRLFFNTANVSCWPEAAINDVENLTYPIAAFWR
jgi:hypothetical protein